MKDYYFNPGSTKVNQLNIGVVGDLGTGKTQLLKSLIYQMSFNSLANRGKAPKFLILDTKRDYDGTGSELDAAFIEAIGAKVLLPYNLPINIFDIKGAKQLNPAYHRAQFFIDVLGKIYKGIGPVQRDNLRNAILASYTEKGYRDGANNAYIDFEAPTLKDVRDKYKELVGKVDSPLAIINSLIDQQLFTNVAADTMSFKDLFDRTIVVSLGLVAGTDESLRLLMVIFLKLYQEYMINIDKAPFLGHGDETLRKVDSFILIDEAKLIMDYGFPVLEDVLRKGREFGVGVILSTQYLSDYGRTDIDYRQPLSTWFIHKVPSLTVKDLKSIGITSATDDVVQKIQEAGKHFCLYKTVGVNGEFMRGTPLYELLRHRDNEDKTDL
jgi:DNA helicase HerA-like ATPase